ncbi:hypothetical protein HPP92_017470 [Vanilla planifolia]|uniref:cellulase n=1 Tax=Vanilla planifolia TaxID=51239 RepID=A0A835USA4_VANPL|nr:hypothetical protein HPP92_017470 [Vanilla planifolia]
MSLFTASISRGFQSSTWLFHVLIFRPLSAPRGAHMTGFLLPDRIKHLFPQLLCHSTPDHQRNSVIHLMDAKRISLLYLSILIVLPPAHSAAAFDYKDALSKSLLYLEAQRSGHLPYNQRTPWRHHSGLTDGLQQGVDLVGGYYDAGDHVKFGLPMAFTVTMLSWSAVEYGEEIAAAGEYQHALEAIKWGTDYFIKAHTQPDVFWAEVGDGATDHYCWQRPEDMTTPRQAYKIEAGRPGSDLAGETAAAMAAASIVFRRWNPHYSHVLLHHAQQLFEFGDRHRGKYDGSVEVVKNYYASVSGYMDELLWAALWLHRATGKREYLDYVVENADAFGASIGLCRSSAGTSSMPDFKSWPPSYYFSKRRQFHIRIS